MSMAMESRDGIVSELESIDFTIRWVNPVFDPDARGFELL